MKKIITLCIFVVAVTAYGADNKPASVLENDLLAKQIIAMEKSALEKWNNGDPSGYIDISSKDISGFSPSLERRLDGLDNVTKLLESARGKIHVDKYEMLYTKVQSEKDLAVLTYNLVCNVGERTDRWDCTIVYRLENDGKWRIIHAHRSFTKPNLN
jgi:ketosteroid isomerase-like protein